jgi:hypothetical protein
VTGEATVLVAFGVALTFLLLDRLISVFRPPREPWERPALVSRNGTPEPWERPARRAVVPDLAGGVLEETLVGIQVSGRDGRRFTVGVWRTRRIAEPIPRPSLEPAPARAPPVQPRAVRPAVLAPALPRWGNDRPVYRQVW